MTARKFRDRKTRWPFICATCRRYVLRGERSYNHGDGWICKPCALERALGNITGRTSPWQRSSR